MKPGRMTTLFLTLLLLLTGCRADGPAPADGAFSDMILTKEQMLEDYDAMWAAFGESSPFFGVMERRLGQDFFEDTIAQYRRQLEAMEPEGDDAMIEFIMVIAYSLSEMYEVDRHTGILNSGRFFAYREAYRELVDEMPALQPWLDPMEDPQVEAFYTYYEYLVDLMTAEMEDEGQPEEYAAAEPGAYSDPGPNLVMEVLEEGRAAYIKVLSFDTEYMEGDLPEIRAFLEEIVDFEHLVIDIRENGGGNTDYWEEAFVRPNLSEPAVETSVRLMKDTPLARQFYGADYADSTLRVEDVVNNSAFSALNREDLAGLALAREFVSVTEPEAQQPLFEGDVWVLIGPEVYSSAENFAVFCKATGFATLVGQTTGGGNTGGPVWFELPNSHLLVSFDVEYALNPDGSCTQEIGTTPDMEAADALQAVLDLLETRP